jgi:tripartite-type tricarboxylate transporter receptor subunit TctC
MRTGILGQSVIIENVGGAGGMNGADRVAKAQPDGYTFLLGTVGTQAQNQTLYKKPAYDSTRDFASVGLFLEAPLVLVARKDLPAKSMKEFVAYSRKPMPTRCSSPPQVPVRLFILAAR